MSEGSPPQVEVAVALVTNRNKQVLLVLNDRWGAFNLPMTKRRRGRSENEAMARAAIRAAVEALGVPVRLAKGNQKRLPAQLPSWRQLVIKNYLYDVYRVEPHPDFADRLQIRQPHLWLSPHLALSDAYDPISESTRAILRAVLAAFKIPARVQHTSVLVLQRDDPERGREFLVRRNRDWGYSLPAKRWEPPDAEKAEDIATAALDAAQRVAREELGLEPVTDVTIALRFPEFTTHGVRSPRKEAPAYGAKTEYKHSLFEARVRHPEKIHSKAALAWVTEEEVHHRQTAGSHGVPGAPSEHPGSISHTTYEILLHLGLIAEDVDITLEEEARIWVAQHGGGQG